MKENSRRPGRRVGEWRAKKPDLPHAVRERGLLLAIEAAGGIRALGRRLGNLAPSTVARWRRIPEHWLEMTERETGLPRRVLRPDLTSEEIAE